MRRELARETAETRIILDSRRSCHAATAASAPASPGAGAVLLFTPGPNHLSHQGSRSFCSTSAPAHRLRRLGPAAPYPFSLPLGEGTCFSRFATSKNGDPSLPRALDSGQARSFTAHIRSRRTS